MASIEKCFRQKLYIEELRTFLVIIENSFGATFSPQIAKVTLTEV